MCDFIGHYVIPNLAGIFITSYWIIGILKYNYPDFEFLDHLYDWEILPTSQVGIFKEI